MKLSIITINYNNLAGLKKTADSVINQTWRDFEWIIVDGGSTDGSKEYIEQLAHGLAQGLLPNTQTPSPWRVTRFSNPSYTAQDPTTNHPVILSSDNPSSLIPNPSSPIPHPSSLISNPSSLIPNRGSQSLLWCSEPDKGIYNAMNKGITHAKGEYLNFMNSGDCFYENETLAIFFSQERQSDIYYGHRILVGMDDTHILVRARQHIDLYDIVMSHLCQQSMFIKTELLATKSFDENQKIVSDLKRWIELALQNVEFKYIDLIICKYDNMGYSALNKSQMYEEKEMVLRGTLNPYILDVIYRNYRNEEGHINKRCCNIVSNGGFRSLLLRLFLKVFS